MYAYYHDLAFGRYDTYREYEKYANGSKREYLRPEEYLDFLLAAVPTIEGFGSDKDQVFPLEEERPIYKIITERGICFTLNPSNGIYYTPEWVSYISNEKYLHYHFITTYLIILTSEIVFRYFNSSTPYEYKPILYKYGFVIMKLAIKGNITSDYAVR